MDLDRTIKVYRKIREEREKEAAAFKQKDAELKAKLEKIEQHLLQYCKDTNQTGGRTPHGSFYRTTRTKYWTADWDSFRKFVADHDAFDLLEKRIHQGNLAAFLKENPDDVPVGLNAETQYSVIVKKPTVKAED